jgi:1-acyl-sn-glycerol-3-phosphate acyltransferase
MRIIVSLVVWIIYVLIYILLLIPVTVVFLAGYPFDRYRKIPNVIFMLAGRSILWFNPFWKINFVGLERYDATIPMIFIANHQSFMDMPVLAMLPWKMKWVSKDALMKVPILGFYMRMSGHISVKRGTVSALRALEKLKPYLKAGVPVMLFPEGTRSRSGELIKFKSGAFMLSKDTNIPVQPVLIHGTRNIMKPDTWIASLSGTVTVTLMEPYFPNKFETPELMRDQIYFDMKTELNELGSG